VETRPFVFIDIPASFVHFLKSTFVSLPRCNRHLVQIVNLPSAARSRFHSHLKPRVRPFFPHLPPTNYLLITEGMNSGVGAARRRRVPIKQRGPAHPQSTILAYQFPNVKRQQARVVSQFKCRAAPPVRRDGRGQAGASRPYRLFRPRRRRKQVRW
jgi:hypothetical protein